MCIYTYITVCVLCPLSASMDRQVPAPPTTSPVAMMNIGEDTGEDSLIPSPSPASMPTQATKGPIPCFDAHPSYQRQCRRGNGFLDDLKLNPLPLLKLVGISYYGVFLQIICKIRCKPHPRMSFRKSRLCSWILWRPSLLISSRRSRECRVWPRPARTKSWFPGRARMRIAKPVRISVAY